MSAVVRTFVFVVVLLTISPAAYAEFDPEYFRAAANPHHMEFEIDASSAKTQVVGPLGGIVEIEGEDGTVFNLSVPAGALRHEIPVTVSTLKSSKNKRADIGSVLGIHLSPEGIELLHPAVLTAVTKNNFDEKTSAAIAFHQRGSDVSAALIRVSANEIIVPVLHFSGVAVLDEMSDAALLDLLKTVPSRNIDRIVHGAALAGLQEQKRGGDAKKASKQYLAELSLYTTLAALIDFAIFQARNDGSLASTCEVASSSKMLIPLIELALAQEAIKIINSGSADSGLTPAETDKVLESILIRDNEVFPTVKGIVDMQNQCLGQFIDACYTEGLFAPLESVLESLDYLNISFANTTSAISGQSMISMIIDSLPRIDPHLRSKAEQIAGWIGAFDKALDSNRIAEQIKKHLERCARFEIDLKYDSKLHVDGRHEIKVDGNYSLQAKETLEYGSGVSFSLSGRLLRAEYKITDNFSHCKNYMDTTKIEFSAPMTIKIVKETPRELGEFALELIPGIVITHLEYHDTCSGRFESNDGGYIWSSVMQSSSSSGIPVKFKNEGASTSYPTVFDLGEKGSAAFESGEGTGPLNFEWRVILKHSPGVRLPFP